MWPYLEVGLCRLNFKMKSYWIRVNLNLMCMRVKSLQSRLTLCDPMGCSPPCSSVHGILQARILEWVAISPSRWPCLSSMVSREIFQGCTEPELPTLDPHVSGWAPWIVPLAALVGDLTEHWEGSSWPQGLGLVTSGVWSLGSVPFRSHLMLKVVLHLPSECLLFSAKACPHHGCSSLMQGRCCTPQGVLVSPWPLAGLLWGKAPGWLSRIEPWLVGVREKRGKKGEGEDMQLRVFPSNRHKLRGPPTPMIMMPQRRAVQPGWRRFMK